jgi:hypothetical protein
MTRLRFIKPWGPNKPGDIKDTASQATVHWLVDVYKFAVIEPEQDIYKYVRKPQYHKMVMHAPKAKSKEV